MPELAWAAGWAERSRTDICRRARRVLAAVARRVAEFPHRTVAVTADYSIVRTRAGWIAVCSRCAAELGEQSYPEAELPVRSTYRQAEQDAVRHWASDHGRPG